MRFGFKHLLFALSLASIATIFASCKDNKTGDPSKEGADTTQTVAFSEKGRWVASKAKALDGKPESIESIQKLATPIVDLVLGALNLTSNETARTEITKYVNQFYSVLQTMELNLTDGGKATLKVSSLDKEAAGTYTFANDIVTVKFGALEAKQGANAYEAMIVKVLNDNGGSFPVVNNELTWSLSVTQVAEPLIATIEASAQLWGLNVTQITNLKAFLAPMSSKKISLYFTKQ